MSKDLYTVVRRWAMVREVRHYKDRRYVVQRVLQSTSDKAVQAFHAYLIARNEAALAKIEAAMRPFFTDDKAG